MPLYYKLSRNHRGPFCQSAQPPLPLPHQVLQTQLDTLRQGQEHIGSSCSFAEQALRLGSAPEVLLVRKHMRERLAALAAQAFPERPHENAQLELVLEVDGLRRSVLNLGALLTTSATAHETVATGEGLRQALVGQPASLTVTTKDKDGRLVRTGSAELHADITGPDGTRLPVPVVDHKNGTYELVYTARTEGELLLSVLLYGQPVRGSPFRVRALRPGDLPPSPDDVKRRVKSPGGPGSHVRQKAVRRPSSMYSTGGKRKDNPIEDELVFRVGTVARAELGGWTERAAPSDLRVKPFVPPPHARPQAAGEETRVNSPTCRACPRRAAAASWLQIATISASR